MILCISALSAQTSWVQTYSMGPMESVCVLIASKRVRIANINIHKRPNCDSVILKVGYFNSADNPSSPRDPLSTWGSSGEWARKS